MISICMTIIGSELLTVVTMASSQTPEYRFVRGYEKNPNDPGLLITHNRAKYSLIKSNKSGDLTFENNEKKFVLTKFSDVAIHNHENL